MTEQSDHPTLEQLSGFSRGQLPPEDAESIEIHVGECEPCCETLLGLSSDDTFVALLQEANQPRSDESLRQFSRDTSVSFDREAPSQLVDHPRYTIVAPLGNGGMGDVFKAEHKVMERTVALKVIKRELFRKSEAVTRFHREVKAAARLSHPNIVTAYDAEQAGDVHFLVMEYVDGVDLARHVKDVGALPIAKACDYIKQAALGLQHAHDQGMVHRDIKPHNLMLSTDGCVKILDFGLATLANESITDGVEEPRRAHTMANKTSRLTTLGTMMGTPDFISPEQADTSHAVDVRSDIYSLGCTFYYLLSGQPPFAKGSAMERVKAHGEAEPEQIENVRDDILPETAVVLRRMMAKDPAERFQTPNEVANALVALLDRSRTMPASSKEADCTATSDVSGRFWWSQTVIGRSLTFGTLGLLLGVIFYVVQTAAVSGPTSGPTVKRVYHGYVGYPGNLSYDGRHATVVDWNTGDLAIRDLATGETRRVTSHGSQQESEAHADQSIISRDGKQIAYVWHTGKKQTQLKIVSIDGTGERTLYPGPNDDPEESAILWPLHWSPDDKQILCSSITRAEHVPLILLTVQDGSLREIKNVVPEGEAAVATQFSPDGQYLVFDGKSKSTDSNRDIFLFSLVDGSRTPIVEHPADDYLLGWAPDGNRLVFASDRTGDTGIWTVRVADGSPQGPPELIKTQMGNFERLRMTNSGEYYFSRTSGDRRNIFTASFDPETGEVNQPPTALSPSSDLHRTAPGWISTTNEIVFLEGAMQSNSAATQRRTRIMVHSPENGTTRELVTQPRLLECNFNSLSACPSGKWLALWGGVDDGQSWGVLLIDRENGKVTKVKHGSGSRIFWSRDGRQMYYVGFFSEENRYANLRRDMQTGNVVELSETPPFYDHYSAISPDGQDVAYADEDNASIKVVSITGGESRVLVKAKGINSIFWSPDAHFIGYVQNGQLWRVLAEGGEPERINFEMPPGVKHLRLHGDGSQVLFSAHRYPSKTEIWVLEDFVPTEKEKSD